MAPVSRRALTLTEMLLSLIITAIVLLAMTSQFIAEHRLRAGYKDELEVLEEADIAMNHVSRVFKVSLPDRGETVDNVTETSIVNGYINPFMYEIPPPDDENEFGEKVHVAQAVQYDLNVAGQGVLRFRVQAVDGLTWGDWAVIANNVTWFNVTRTAVPPTTLSPNTKSVYNIDATVEKNNKKVALHTAVQSLVNLQI